LSSILADFNGFLFIDSRGLRPPAPQTFFVDFQLPALDVDSRALSPPSLRACYRGLS
jgi:hypothetical protein